MKGVIHMGYNPPYEITDKIAGYISSISEKVGQVSARSNTSSKPHLRRNNRIRSIHSSLRIESNPLSLNEVKDVINGRIVTGPAKEIQEVRNAYDAYEQIPVIDPYSLSELKRIHGIMTRYVIDESGTFRRGEEGVFDGDRCIFMAPPAKMVPSLMDDLFSWMKESHGRVHPLIMGAVFHYEFVFIHPFADGNGRMARLWHTAILAKWKPLFEYIPIESQIEKFQESYYKAISACHVAGNSTLFIEFILEQIDTVLDEIVDQSKTFGEEVTEYEKRLLEIMEYNEPYTAGTLLELLGLKSRDSLRHNYLDPAIRHGFVSMTLPNKPNSKNQRYVKR